MTERHFTITVDLPESTMSDLLRRCREDGKPVGEIANTAIATYLNAPKPETIDQMLTHISID
jgi:hypothetical protein